MVEPKLPRKPKFRRNFEQLLSVSTLNVLFLIDTTGSMEPYKKLCSDSISLISEKLSKINVLFPNREAKLKMGFVAYRDKKDKTPFVLCSFTSDQKKLITLVKGLDCEGGGDTCEDLKGALQKALLDSKIKWDSMYKFVVLIADSPCHGKKYHSNEESDDYPEEEMTEELSKLAMENIKFIGIIFNDSTKKMYEEIQKVYQGNHGDFYLIEHESLKNIESHENSSQNILNFFVERISNPIEEFTKSTLKSFYANKKISRAFKTIADNYSDFQWDDFCENETFLKEEKFEVYSFTCDPKAINYENISLFEVGTSKINEWKCEISSRIIGKGSFRSIYLFRVRKDEPKKDESPYHLYIGKAPLKKTHYENIEEIKEEWRGNLIANFMAKKFNKDMIAMNDKGDLSISFNDVFILKSKNMENRYFAVEKVLRGPFTKYNNNFGYVADFSNFKEKYQEQMRFNSVAQAFSHYSFEKSNGFILICDLQGVVQRLTDPMILSKNPSKLQGDLSGPGILKFFMSHECNDVCKVLGLAEMEIEIPDDMMKEIEQTEIACGRKSLSTEFDIEDDDKDNDKEEVKDEDGPMRYNL